MKDWWLNLSLREKQTVVIGSVVVILFLLYEIIWSPLVNANAHLRTRIQQNHEALQFMQQADQAIQALVKTSKEKNNDLRESLLGTVQTEINQSAFASHVTQLRQSENDSVQFNLRKVDFDQFIAFLTALWKKDGLVVSQMTVIPTGTPGEVTIDVMIQSS